MDTNLAWLLDLNAAILVLFIGHVSIVGARPYIEFSSCHPDLLHIPLQVEHLGHIHIPGRRVGSDVGTMLCFLSIHMGGTI